MIDKFDFSKLKLNIIHYLGFASIIYLYINTDKYILISNNKFINSLGWNILSIFFIIIFIDILLRIINYKTLNVYIDGIKKFLQICTTFITAGLGFLNFKLIKSDILYEDIIYFKTGISFKRRWTVQELEEYFKLLLDRKLNSNEILDYDLNISLSQIINQLKKIYINLEG